MKEERSREERRDFSNAIRAVKERMHKIRAETPKREFDLNKPGEVEVNKFHWKGKEVDRIMVVLRATGCDYFLQGGCSMCGHYDGTAMVTGGTVSSEQYKNQWDYVVENFNLDNFPIVCLYNLGDFLSEREIPVDARVHMFNSLNDIEGVEKVIIEARAEHVNEEVLEPIREAWDGVIEVGVGLESSDDTIRNLCHRKSLSRRTYEKAMRILNKSGFESLSYINMKPPFLTEQEAINDAISSALYAREAGSKAVSIEPTSIQEHTLTEELTRFGQYRVPWLWSVVEVVKGITETYKEGEYDLRIGGYFPEEVLYGSGSGGAFPFPTICATNCDECDPRLIRSFAKFNETYDPSHITSQEPCDVCYDTWERSLEVTDSRSIVQRVFDTLGEARDGGRLLTIGKM